MGGAGSCRVAGWCSHEKLANVISEGSKGEVAIASESYEMSVDSILNIAKGGCNARWHQCPFMIRHPAEDM